jgi:hypothetical protein
MSTNTGKALKKIDELREALSSLLNDDLMKLSPAAQLQCLQALRPAVCQMQALQLRLVGAVDAHKTTRSEGSASTATWLRNTLHLPHAAEVVKSATAISRMPMVAAALAAGEINDAHVATIAKVAETLPPPALSEGVEELLVRQASQLPPSKFVPVASRIRDEAAPPSAARPAKEAATRWLRTDQRVDGRVRLSGLFDPESGRIVLAALTPTEHAMSRPAADVAARTAEALIELCRRVVCDRTGESGAAESATPDLQRRGGRQRLASLGAHMAGGSTHSAVGLTAGRGGSTSPTDRSMTSTDDAAEAAASSPPSYDDGTAAATGSPPHADARRAGTPRKPKHGRGRRSQQRSPNRR